MTYQVFDVNSAFNDASRIMITIFAVLWFIWAFVSVVLMKTKKITKLPMLCDALVFLLSLSNAAHNFSHISDGNLSFYTDVLSCEQWQVTAITITIAWLNLLLHMRLLFKVRKKHHRLPRSPYDLYEYYISFLRPPYSFCITILCSLVQQRQLCYSTRRNVQNNDNDGG